jgi:hypothetical protein
VSAVVLILGSGIAELAATLVELTSTGGAPAVERCLTALEPAPGDESTLRNVLRELTAGANEALITAELLHEVLRTAIEGTPGAELDVWELDAWKDVFPERKQALEVAAAALGLVLRVSFKATSGAPLGAVEVAVRRAVRVLLANGEEPTSGDASGEDVECDD